MLIEPVVAARYVPESARTLLDAGSGGGSPALPLKLAKPRLQLRMVEVKTRKAVFLREAVRTLGLARCGSRNLALRRLLPRAELHESLDLVSIRAVRIEARTLADPSGVSEDRRKNSLFRGPGGLDLQDSAPPPLRWMATYPLVNSLHSKLVVLSKTGSNSAELTRFYVNEPFHVEQSMLLFHVEHCAESVSVSPLQHHN